MYKAAQMPRFRPEERRALFFVLCTLFALRTFAHGSEQSSKCQVPGTKHQAHSTSLLAQQHDVLYLKIENSIRENEPAWTLLNAWAGPHGRAMGYRWKLDQHEIFVMVIRQPSIADAVTLFQDDGLGPLPGKTDPLKLDVGDECYLRRAGPHTVVVIRKDDLLIRLGSDSSGPEWLSRFARHIGNALAPITTSHRKKAELALAAKRYEEAIEEFREAIRVEGETAEAYQGLGLAYLQSGDRAKAIESFKEALRLKPDWAQTHYELGQSYYEAGNYKSAANSLEEAVRLQPDFFEALISLSKAYQHSGLHASAVTVLQKAVLLRPANLDTRTSLGAALILAGQPQDAIAVLEELVRLSPESALVYANLGQAYRLTGKYQEALNALTQALRISPEDPVVHNWLGLSYETLERKAEAMAAYRRAIELKSDYAEAHYNLGVLYLVLGDRNQAEHEYNVLKSLNSDLAHALLQRMNR